MTSKHVEQSQCPHPNHGSRCDDCGICAKCLTAARAEVERLRALASNLALQGHNALCHYCTKPCNGLAGDPGKWPVALCHENEPGVVKWHHVRCVSERLAEVERLKSVFDAEWRRAEVAYDEIDRLRAEVKRLKAELRETSDLLIASTPIDLVCLAQTRCASCGDTMTGRLGTELKASRDSALAEVNRLKAEVENATAAAAEARCGEDAVARMFDIANAQTKVATKMLAARDAEILAALKFADALTLDTQTIGEAVAHLVEMVRQARDEIAKLRAETAKDQGRYQATCDEDDRPLPEDEAIAAAFPTRSGEHNAYNTAMRLVGAKQSKGALVALVNWLIVERKTTNVRAARLEEALVALLPVAEDCAVHHTYVTKGQEAAAELRRTMPGVRESVSAGDHWIDADKAVERARAALASATPDVEKEPT